MTEALVRSADLPPMDACDGDPRAAGLVLAAACLTRMRRPVTV